MLYSDTDQISSPIQTCIQRTEKNFCEDKQKFRLATRPIKKFSKLTSLASDINKWNDDYSHHQTKTIESPKKTGTIPKINILTPVAKKFTAGSQYKGIASGFKSTPSTTSTSSSKKLLWDQKVIDSLEAQGFTRRDTTGPKLVYDYKNDKPSTSAAAGVSSPLKNSFAKPVEVKKAPSPAPVKKFAAPSKPAEQKNVRFSNMFQKNQKDPAEMSLKDRMAIFEKNKGTAPVPKTPFGIADANSICSNIPKLSKRFIFEFANKNQDKVKKQSPASVEKVPAANIKTTVSKLLTGKEMTISEKQINNGIKKQRVDASDTARTDF